MEDRKISHLEIAGEITQEEVKGIVEHFQAAEIPPAVNADEETAQGAIVSAPIAVEVPHADDTGDSVIPAEVPRTARGENTTINHIDELGFYEAKTAGNITLVDAPGKIWSSVDEEVWNAGNANINSEGVQGVVGPVGEPGIPEINNSESEVTTPAVPEARLGFGEEWIDTREGNNKKWRAPSTEKRRKQMAKASKRRNRRA